MPLTEESSAEDTERNALSFSLEFVELKPFSARPKLQSSPNTQLNRKPKSKTEELEIRVISLRNFATDWKMSPVSEFIRKSICKNPKQREISK